MEDDLKISKVEYLSNRLVYLPQSLNLSLGDQTKSEYCLKLKGPSIENKLKILKVEYPSSNY